MQETCRKGGRQEVTRAGEHNAHRERFGVLLRVRTMRTARRRKDTRAMRQDALPMAHCTAAALANRDIPGGEAAAESSVTSAGEARGRAGIPYTVSSFLGHVVSIAERPLWSKRAC